MTKKFEIVTGINEGYFHNNEKKQGMEIVGVLWQKLALEEFNQSEMYISAIVSNSITVYNENWGCPKGGEQTVVITGVANPDFIKDLNKWTESVKRIAIRLKEELKQSTITVEFKETDLLYLK